MGSTHTHVVRSTWLLTLDFLVNQQALRIAIKLQRTMTIIGNQVMLNFSWSFQAFRWTGGGGCEANPGSHQWRARSIGHPLDRRKWSEAAASNHNFKRGRSQNIRVEEYRDAIFYRIYWYSIRDTSWYELHLFGGAFNHFRGLIVLTTQMRHQQMANDDDDNYLQLLLCIPLMLCSNNHWPFPVHRFIKQIKAPGLWKDT